MPGKVHLSAKNKNRATKTAARFKIFSPKDLKKRFLLGRPLLRQDALLSQGDCAARPNTLPVPCASTWQTRDPSGDSLRETGAKRRSHGHPNGDSPCAPDRKRRDPPAPQEPPDSQPRSPQAPPAPQSDRAMLHNLRHTAKQERHFDSIPERPDFLKINSF